MERNYESSGQVPSESNFNLMRRLLKKYHPAVRGILGVEEEELIRAVLKIGERNLMSLQNLRDFTVLYIDCEREREADNLRGRELFDILSAVTYVIDSEKIRLGGEA